MFQGFAATWLAAIFAQPSGSCPPARGSGVRVIENEAFQRERYLRNLRDGKVLDRFGRKGTRHYRPKPAITYPPRTMRKLTTLTCAAAALLLSHYSFGGTISASSGNLSFSPGAVFLEQQHLGPTGQPKSAKDCRECHHHPASDSGKPDQCAAHRHLIFGSDRLVFSGLRLLPFSLQRQSGDLLH